MKRIYALMALLIGLTYSSQAQNYCTTSLYTTGCTVGDDLDDVTLNNLVQTNTGCSTNGYADYTADTILVQQTAFLNISVTSNYSNQFYAIWIDANDDGDFDDAGEQIWASTAASGTAGTTTADAFVIPSTVPIGNHRLRMRGKFAGTALASTESCTSFTYGETHDYTVLVAGPPACPQPYALIAGSATATNFTFSFTSTGSSFDLEYGPAGFTQGTGSTGTATTTTHTMTGLTANTCYDVYVRQNCSSAGNGYSNWSGPISFCTPCVTQAIPLAETFTNWPPNCFDLAGGTSSWTHDSTNFAAHADMSTWGSSGDGMMTSPPMSLQGLTRVKFRWSHAPTTWNLQSMHLVVQKSGTTTWDTLWSVANANFDSQDGATFSSPGTYKQEVFNLDSATYYNSVAQFRWIAITSWGNDAWVDNINIEAQPLCPEPTGLGINGVSDTSASLTWTSAGSSFPLEWGPTGYTQGTGFLDTAVASSHTITGLIANTTYDYYVKRNCSGQGNGSSGWEGPFTFTTLCAPYTISSMYNENWDAMTAGDLPNCWNVTGTGSGLTFQVFLPGTWSTAAYSTPNYTVISTANAADVTAVSPMFSDLPGNNAQVRFRANTLSAWSSPQLIVGTMTTPSDPNSFTAVDTLTLMNSWDEYTIALPVVPSNHYHVGFRVYSASSWVQVGIDDFAYEVQPSCVPPSNATALPASTTALLSWSHGTPSTTGSVVTWGPAGYNPGTGTVSNAVNVSATSYNITGLTSNTAYTAWVADSCGAGNISPWHGPINFTTSCVAATLPYSDNFDVNPLPCWDFTGGSQTMTQYATASGYAMRGNFWSWPSGNDAYLTSRPVTISANSEVSFNWSHQYMSSYPNDQLLLLGKTTTSSTWDTLVNLVGATDFNSTGAGITTPGNYVNTTVYVPTSYTGSDAIFRFATLSGYGPDVFIDDFLVEAIASCPDPTSSAGTRTHNSIDISWVSQGTPLGSNVMWGPTGFYSGTGTFTGSRAFNVSSTHTIGGLLAGTTYDVYVQDSCGANDLSGWAGPLTMTTTLCPPANMCTFTFYMVDSYGDGWNGCLVDLQQSANGSWSTAATFGSGFTSGYNAVDSSSLCSGDSARIVINAPGGWPTEVSFDLVGPFGDTLVSHSAGASLSGFQLMGSFLASCNSCASPASVTASSTACTTGSVAWTSGSSALTSQVDYGVATYSPSAATATTYATSAGASLSGLLPGTTYDVFVRDSCSDGWSAWSQTSLMTASGPLPTLNTAYLVTGMSPVTIEFTANASGQDSVYWTMSTGAALGGDVVTHSFSNNGPEYAVATAFNTCGSVSDTVFFTVGLEELGLLNLSIYPNPSSGVFNVAFALRDAGDVQIRIHNMVGEEIARSSHQRVDSQMVVPFDLTSMPAGVYVVEIQTQQGVRSRRIVMGR